ncbi:T9SS type A sorting domain-containing protein [Arenibacter amylolyticus]|uniref:T9SS type A sorting domain-containing protein n=1 Tax=Arenibacter amylolyticus TaxID=1406873 RepID=UPI000A3B102F|nr:T9SS type A sorting domain-containing protein [Arenibacter amylolyticus]
MKKNVFLLLLILSNLAFSQEKEYDVYLNYSFIGTGNDPRIAEVDIKSNSSIGSPILFNNNFPAPVYDGPFDIRGINGIRSSNNSVAITGTLDVSILGEQTGDFKTINLSMDQPIKSFLLSADYTTFSANLTFRPKMEFSLPENSKCYKDKITVIATPGHPQESYYWEYSVPSKNITWKPLSVDLQEKNELEINLIDIVGVDYEEFIGEVIYFRLTNTINKYDVPSLSYNWINCSPELIDDNPITTTDASCFGSNNGAVTLTFKQDIAPESQMRFFVYEGELPNSTTEENLRSESPEFPGISKQTVLDPLLRLTQTENGYKGSIVGLSGNSLNQDNTLENFSKYFIVYQEVDYSVTPAIVKSGELTPTTFRIHQPTQVVLDTSSTDFFTDASCGKPATFNLNDTAMGGDNLFLGGNYSYQFSMDNGTSWDPVEPANNVLEIEPHENQQTILIRGVYHVDGKNCVGEEYQFIIAPIVPPIIITDSSAGTTSTAAASDGSVEVEFSGGIKEYTYKLTRLNIDTNIYEEVMASPTIGLIPNKRIVSYYDLPIGTYRITITDGNNCTQESADLTINVEPTPTLGTPEITQMECEGSYASISVPVSNYSSNYQYQWIINGEASAIQTSGNPNITANYISTPGNHILKVANGGVSDADFNKEAYTTNVSVQIDNPKTVIITNATPNATQCENATDGSIDLTISGGNSFEYSLEFFPSETDWSPLIDNSITNLAPGKYRVTIRNENGCESETLENIIVEEATPLEVTISKTDATTHSGSQGSINLNITGGTPFSAPNDHYNISWEKDGISFEAPDPSTPYFISGLEAGDYIATVTDANGCDNFISINITEPGPLKILSFTSTDACNNLNNGSLSASVQGSGQLTFNWILKNSSPTGTVVATTTTLDGNSSVEGLAPGTYALNIIEDASGNEVHSDQDLIIAEAAPFAAIITTTESSCGNPNSGTISISEVSGGTPFSTGSPYEYHINDAFDNYQSEPVFHFLSPRTYIVTIRDAQGCEYSETVEVTQAGAPIIDHANTILTNPSSPGGADGSITLSFNEHTSDYSYEWSGPGIDGDTSKDITGLVAGNYQVTITTPENCSSVANFTLSDPNPLSATITQTDFLECNGDNFAEITAHIQDGTKPYTYKWFEIINGNNVIVSGDTEILGGLFTGTYFLQVTDANNTTVNTSPLTIAQPDALTVQVDAVTDILCGDEATGAVNISVSGGTAPYSYIWSNGSINQNLDQVPAGEYTLEIMDANACFTEITAIVQNAPNSLQVTNVSISNASAYLANDGSITLNITGGSSPYDITWTKLSNNEILEGQESISNLSSDLYQVSIKDINGCSITEIYEVVQPDIVEDTIVQPSCSGNSDGSISLLVNQGDGDYTYLWNTGATTNAISNLQSGNYSVTITGFENGPLTRSYVLEEPLALEVDLGETKTLCSGQELVLDASIEDGNAKYSWTSDTGFTSTSPNAIIKEGGTYTVTISTQNGCSTTGSVLVVVNDDKISAEFAMSSQVFVGEPLIAVDISFPLPESQKWILPKEAIIVKEDTDEAKLIFNEPGEYEIGIITQIGDCMAQKTKKVLVVANENNVNKGELDPRKQLEDFIIYPNPTSGKFTADIKLSQRGSISIKVFNFANNALMAAEKERGSATYRIPLDISGLPVGVYAVVLETPFGNSLRKVILK